MGVLDQLVDILVRELNSGSSKIAVVERRGAVEERVWKLLRPEQPVHPEHDSIHARAGHGIDRRLPAGPIVVRSQSPAGQTVCSAYRQRGLPPDIAGDDDDLPVRPGSDHLVQSFLHAVEHPALAPTGDEKHRPTVVLQRPKQKGLLAECVNRQRVLLRQI